MLLELITGAHVISTKAALGVELGKHVATAKALATEFGNIAKTELAIAGVVAKNNKQVQKVLSPIGTVFHDAQKTITKVGRNILATSQETAKDIGKHPKLLPVKRILHTFDLLITNVRFNEKIWHHVHQAEVITYKMAKELGKNPGLKSGMHTVEAFERVIKLCNLDKKRLKIEELANGITRILFPKGYGFAKAEYWKKSATYLPNGKKLQGVKTLWPAHYNKEKILGAAREILSNPLNMCKPNKFVGRTSNGIKTTVYIDQKGMITTTFPCWSQ